MSITVELSPEMEARLASRAAAAGLEPSACVLALLEDGLSRETALPGGYVRPTTPPAWLNDIKPTNPSTDGTNGLHRVIGAWPGDETEEDLLALERLFDD